MLPNHCYYITLLLIITSCSIIDSKSVTAIKSNSQKAINNHTIKTKSPVIKIDKLQNQTDRSVKENQQEVKQVTMSSNEASKKHAIIPPDKTEDTTQSETTQKKHHKPINKTITVKNNITTDMITYKHWTGTHEPFFILTVNGKKIEQGKQEEITVKDNRLEVRYDYSFANGFRKDTTIVSCNIEKNAKDVDITFSWDDEWHIKTDNAQPQKVEQNTFSG
ncbi:MAG TPA: hypothetical protein ENI08_01460 [Candidatus Dependentiae bacterium]|nr:hypothetical protein [Candidatus Dependentiae bacterium]